MNVLCIFLLIYFAPTSGQDVNEYDEDIYKELAELIHKEKKKEQSVELEKNASTTTAHRICVDDKDCKGSVCSIEKMCVDKGSGGRGIREKCSHDSDCMKNMNCEKHGLCDTHGRKGDYCENLNDCRNGLFCKNNTCCRKGDLGMICEDEIQCHSGICEHPQWKHQRHRKTSKSCVIRDSKLGEPCHPQTIHCMDGLVCGIHSIGDKPCSSHCAKSDHICFRKCLLKKLENFVCLRNPRSSKKSCYRKSDYLCPTGEYCKSFKGSNSRGRCLAAECESDMDCLTNNSYKISVGPLKCHLNQCHLDTKTLSKREDEEDFTNKSKKLMNSEKQTPLGDQTEKKSNPNIPRDSYMSHFEDHAHLNIQDYTHKEGVWKNKKALHPSI